MRKSLKVLGMIEDIMTVISDGVLRLTKSATFIKDSIVNCTYQITLLN